jgi:hypothetical protein
MCVHQTTRRRKRRHEQSLTVTVTVQCAQSATSSQLASNDGLKKVWGKQQTN